MTLESKFQSELIKEIKALLPGVIILKNDPNYIQGFPDLTILYKDRWALLEIKRGKNATRQPNQEHYILTAKAMSYASFIYPENREEVLDELQRALRSQR